LSHFITVDELLTDPEPLDIDTGQRIKDKKSGEMVDATIRFYPRRPTDIEKDMCASAANGARRAYRKLLENPKSKEHQLRLKEPLEDADDESLRTLWVQGNLMVRAAQIQLNSLEDREVVPEPEGDIIPPIVHDAHEDAAEEAEDDRVKNLIEAINAAKTELENDAKAIPHDDLMQAAMPAHIESLAQGVWNDVYTANIIVFGTFTDKDYRKPAFKTTSQVEKLRSQKPRIYRRLADTHSALLLDLEPTLGKSDAVDSSSGS